MTRSPGRLRPVIEAWEWQMLGRCRDRNGAQFFHPDEDLGRISRRLREAAAKRLCLTCPVRPECATHALRVGEEYGVWGGFSERERSVLQAVGWQDTLDPTHQVANVERLDRRLAAARATQRIEQARPGAGGPIPARRRPHRRS